MAKEPLIHCMVTQEWTNLMHIQMQSIRGVEEEGPLLRQEVDLLRRVLRRNRDQHVASLFYKKMEHVFRLIVRACSIVEESVSVYVALKKASMPVTSVCERQVPCVESGIRRLECILGQCQLLVSVIQACFKAAKQCCVQLAQSFFMPLSVACLAVCARIQLLSVSLLRQKCNEYNSFVHVIRYLPSRESPSNGCGIDVEQLPDHVLCSVQKGQVPGLRMNSRLEGMKDRNLLGLYISGPDGHSSPGMDPGCVVTEDRGLPVRREDLMHIICDTDKGVADTQAEDIAPAFETSSVPMLGMVSEENGPSRGADGVQKNETKHAVQNSEKLEKIQVREAVPSLGQRKTEFIRIGDTKSHRKKSKKCVSNGTSKDKDLPLKSWEDWVSLPSHTDWRGVEDSIGKNKKRRRKR
mmetsp:Transcript_3976/g.8065  ORF Transcript_3976/g.8065 Transcript_3976/m.8065 type:complete len:409 (+) Transcript_3976:33-1259(+)